MLKLVLLSDTHGCQSEVVQSKPSTLLVPDGDVLVHCGDFSSTGSLTDLSLFDAYLATLPHAVKVVCPGNHDLFVGEFPLLARQSMRNAHLFINERFYISTTPCFATPFTPMYQGWAFEAPDDRREKLFAQIPDDTEILFSHAAPYGIGDEVETGEHIGDKLLMARVRALKKLKYHIFGHIHYGYGTTREEGGVTFINCAIMDEDYVVKNKPVVLYLP